MKSDYLLGAFVSHGDPWKRFSTLLRHSGVQLLVEWSFFFDASRHQSFETGTSWQAARALAGFGADRGAG